MRIIWSRLLVKPTTRVLSRDGHMTLLRVDGMVCSGICAARTRRSLQRLLGVERVEIDHARGVATIIGAPHEAAVYERAVASQVIGRRLRGIVERVSRFFEMRGAQEVHR